MPKSLELPSADPFSGDNIAQAAPSTNKDEDNQQDIQVAQKILAEWRAESKDYDDFDECDNWYSGKHWPSSRPKYKSAPVVNLCRPVVETILPIITDTSPSFTVSGKDPSDYTFGEILGDVIDTWWARAVMDMTITGWCKNALKYKAGILKVRWNEDAEGGSGDIECDVIDPRNVGVNRGTVDFNHSTNHWVCHRMTRTVGELKRAFPELADKIHADGSAIGASDGNKSKAYRGDIIPVAEVTRKTSLTNLVDVQGTGNPNVSEVTFFEIWMKDETVDDYVDEQGNTVQKMRYPKGKIITFIESSNLILQSKPNPRKDGMFPFIRLVSNLEPTKFWGEGDIASLIPVNELMKRVMANIIDHSNMVLNTPWIIDSDSGVDPEELTNQIGLVVSKVRGTEVRRDPPPGIPPQLFDLYQTLMSLGEYQSGVHDVTQGRKPAGITAAEAINSLQEAAQTRIRLKERNLQSSLRQLGYLVIGLILQYYRTPRVVRMTGKQGWPEYFEFYIDEDAEGNYLGKSRKYIYNETDKKYSPDEQWQVSNPSKGVFDVSVVSGISLPWMKEKRAAQAQKLFEAGIIDAEELLSTIQWPNKEQVLNRMKAKQEAEASAQVGAPGLPPPTPTA